MFCHAWTRLTALLVRQKESALLRVLVLGAGVIGSVYAGKLLQAGHEVVVLARGHRLSDLQAHGLVLLGRRVRGPHRAAGARGERSGGGRPL